MLKFTDEAHAYLQKAVDQINLSKLCGCKIKTK